MCVFVHVCAYHCLDVLGTLCIFESVAGLLKGRARWADVCNHGSAAVAAKGVLRMMGEEESRECDRDSKHSELNYLVQTATEGGRGGRGGGRGRWWRWQREEMAPSSLMEFAHGTLK